MRARLDAQRDELEPRLIELEEQRTSRRLAAPLRTWIDNHFTEARDLAGKNQFKAEWLEGLRRQVSGVLRVVTQLAEDRKDPELAASLGDADALAAACYTPVIAWARAENVPLAAAEPATVWGDFNLSIWTGFQPTGVAPIFLPEDFFAKAAWWPALSHEIAHSFLASSQGLEVRLRRDLKLASEPHGRRPLTFEGDSLPSRELDRVLGGWFEELFCDVFSTLMLGPAYLATMHALFAADPEDGDPRDVLAVGYDEDSGLYGEHPPRHLRMLAGCRVLEKCGLSEEARKRRLAWEAHHVHDGQAPDRILFPMPEQGGYLALPLPPIEERVLGLVDRLLDGPLPALSGMGLSDVGGLGFGPHEQQEAQRARSAIVAGQVPRVRDPRSVIAGLVLAVHGGDPRKPAADELRLLTTARRAILALGTGEQRLDVYQKRGATAAAAPGRIDAQTIRDAMVLSAILQRRT
jgi:hypothetical protein